MIKSIATVAALLACACAKVSSDPFATPAQRPRGERSALDLTVMTYNIKHGQGNAACRAVSKPTGTSPAPDCNLNLEGSIAVLRRFAPDIVSLQEVDRFWSRSREVDQPVAIAKGMGMAHHCFAPNLDHPADAHSPRPHQYGTAIVSRFPILECANTLLATFDGWEQRGALGARIDVNGATLRVFSTHLQASRSVGGTSVSGQPQRVQQVQGILKILSGVTEPIVVMGDFNATPSSIEMSPIAGRLVDAWTTRGAGHGLTSPADLTRDPGSRIDYIFVSRDVEVTSVSVPVDDETRMASDHYPIIAKIVLPTGRAPR